MAADAPDLTIRVTEPQGEPARRLADLGLTVLPIEEDEGPVDRYVLASHVAAERRTGATLLRGIQDKTFFTSAIYLREHFEVPVLIVEGEIDYDHTGFHPQAVRGALSAMVLEYGLTVISTPDPEETAHFLAMMARHAQVGVPEISLVPKRKAVDPPDLQRRVVEMLPGCGRVTARDLLHYFGSIERIVAATEAALREVRGIGKKRAAEIHGVLHGPYEAVDTERQLEDAIEADPGLLFDHPVDLITRQHVITVGEDRNVVDLVFFDALEDALMMVELKRGALTADHEAQVLRYMAAVSHSPVLRPYLDKGADLRGILATVTPCDYRAKAPDIDVIVVDASEVIDVLKRLRAQRWTA
jgi:ERCC4-type nuclease